MSAVLRGRTICLEQSLGVLAETMKKQLPRYVIQLPGPAHNVFVPAFVGEESRLYTVDLVFTPDRKSYNFRYTRHVLKTPSGTTKTPRFGLAGSGGLYLNRNKKWIRGLLRVVKAHERGKVSPDAVAEHLAKLNNEVHLGITDRSVGPSCIVAWRHKHGGVHKDGGGHQFYTGTTRDANSLSLPAILNGLDVHALIGVMYPHMLKSFEGIGTDSPPKEIDEDALNAELARLPDTPNEDLF